MAYLHKFLVALDQLGNVTTGGADDDTISSRLARGNLRGTWWGRAGCATLSFISRTDHCSLALDGDRRRALAELDRLKGDS